MQQSSATSNQVVCPRGATAYTWKEGDTLESVALDRGITAQSMTLANPDTDFNTLAPGSTVCIPPRIFSCLSGELYQVKAGDTFQKIAEAYGISTLELAERNPGVKENELQFGQVICVPKAESGNNGNSGSNGNQQGGSTSTWSCPVGYAARTVREGQSYADLLIENNVSYRAMRTTNPQLVPGRLITGMRYCAPPAGTRQLCGTGTQTYTVQPDETLAMVAERFRTTPGRLMQLNPTLLPTDFSSGTIICVP